MIEYRAIYNIPKTSKPSKTSKQYKEQKSQQKEQKYKNINHNKIRQMEFLQNLTNDFPDIYPPIPPISPHFSKTNKNVGILFWYLQPPSRISLHEEIQQIQQIQILTGIETCYLTDKVVPEIKVILQKYQYYSTALSSSSNEEQEVYQQFSKRAKLLSKELKQPIYFDKPIAHSTQPNLWQTQFRVTGEKPKFGIIKGSMEENETQIQAIHREIQEELFPYNDFIPLEKENIHLLPQPIQLNNDSLYTFHYQVTEKEKNLIENNIQHLQEENYGELVHYQFRTMTEIFTSPQSNQPNFHLLKQHFNGKSRLYINEFYHHFHQNQK
jgi:hypothetical protein